MGKITSPYAPCGHSKWPLAPVGHLCCIWMSHSHAHLFWFLPQAEQNRESQQTTCRSVPIHMKSTNISRARISRGRTEDSRMRTNEQRTYWRFSSSLSQTKLSQAKHVMYAWLTAVPLQSGGTIKTPNESEFHKKSESSFMTDYSSILGLHRHAIKK